VLFGLHLPICVLPNYRISLEGCQQVMERILELDWDHLGCWSLPDLRWSYSVDLNLRLWRLQMILRGCFIGEDVISKVQSCLHGA
jgi:hypothetical protein